MTREELEQLATKRLRALARQHLATQARSLRTRGALLAALTQTLASRAVSLEAHVPGGRGRTPTRTAGVRVGAAPTSATPPLAPSNRPAPEADVPVEESFFIGPRAARPGPRPGARTQEADGRPSVPAAEPGPAALEETLHLLSRDPSTLFLYWEFRTDTEPGQAAAVFFRVYEGEALVRTVEAPTGRRSLYLEGLQPGHLYRVEAWRVGSDGQQRPTARPSASLRLAPAAPSGRLEVEMARVPVEQPLARWRRTRQAGASSSSAEPLEAPVRLQLPASLDWRGGPGAAGPHSGRP